MSYMDVDYNPHKKNKFKQDSYITGFEMKHKSEGKQIEPFIDAVVEPIQA